MTLSEDINFMEGGELTEAKSAYPVVFGISFTPKIIGILVGGVGFVGALYMLFNLVMPAWDTFGQNQNKQSELQGQVDQKKATIKQMDQVKQELAEAKQQQTQVLGLFANEKTLDTLLLDLNRLVEANNSTISINATRAELKKFVPVSDKAEPITDGSLGKQVDGKLKRRSVNVEILGTYEQTQSILRNIERLQALLIVKDYQSALAPQPTLEPGKRVLRVGPAAISTSFQLQALIPLSPEEAAGVKAEPKK
ncbi:pilus assembly protein PilO [Mastigocladus laminosus UU774]|nr:pilus assembly protein PilO [Mastigocladus laminosus UU774]